MAVSTNNDLVSQAGNFKQTYAKDMADNRPSFTVLQELLKPNRDGIEVGAAVNVPVVLTQQGGETYGLSGDTSNLRAPVSMEIKDATADQFEITFPIRMPFALISKANQSTKARYADKARLILLSGDTGAKRGAELALIHGSNGLAQVSAVSGVTGPVAGLYSIDITITAPTWSDGLWGMVENLPFDVYSAKVAGTKRNVNDVTLAAVKGWSNDQTLANRRVLTFTAPNAADLSGIAPNDFIYSASAYAKQLPGLLYQLSLLAGQTHLGLSTNYSAWRPKQVPISGPLTFGKMLSGIAPIVSHAADGELTVLVSPANWADLSKDLASARRADWSYKNTEMANGAKKIAFSYNNGDLAIIQHPFIPDGVVPVFNPDNWFRAGSDPDPIMKLDEMALQVMSSTANVIEVRFWSAQTLIPNFLATSLLFTGITPNPS
jgi:hypothetical protein